jgi:hypothetical protein
MSELITLALYALATARAVRLIMKDEITRAIRKWIEDHTPAGSLRRYLITCMWCLSIWCAMLPAAGYVLAPHHPAALIPAAVLTFSWLAVILYDLQRLLDGKANLYNLPMPEPDLQPDRDEQEAQR